MRIVLILLFAGFALAALAQTDPPGEPTPAEATPAEPARTGTPSAAPEATEFEAPEGFEAVSGAGDAQSDIPALPLVVGAYLIIWGLTFGYLVLLWTRQGAVKRELETLTRRLEEAAKD